MASPQAKTLRRRSPTRAWRGISRLRRKRGRVLQIVHALEAEHGTPDLGNHSDPLSELGFIALTRQTHAKNASLTWTALRMRYPSWELVAEAPEDELVSTIVKGGFARQKARWIQQSLRLLADRGDLSLDFLESFGNEEAEVFLCGLPGTSVKSARCVLMYSLGDECRSCRRSRNAPVRPSHE